MKATLKIVWIAALGICLHACESPENSSQVTLGDIPVNLDNARLGSPVLMTYADVPELVRNIEMVGASLYEDSHEIMDTDSRTSSVIAELEIKNGRVLLSSVYYLDEVNEVIVGGHILDAQTGNYSEVSFAGADWDAVFNGNRCPAGYSQLASCGKSNHPTQCIGNALTAYLSENLSSVGDCAAIQVKVSTLNTRVCSKSC